MKSEEENEQICEKISQELFNKSCSDIKYLMVTNFVHYPLLEEGLTRTGLYQWINVFRGEVKNYKEVKNFNEYDIIHINLSYQDYHLVNLIRSQITNPTTKIVANNDYTVELWQSSFDFPPTMRNELKGADMLFGTEYLMSGALEELSGRKVHIIPHPCFVKRLKMLPKLKKENAIGVIWHRYDKQVFLPHFAVRNHGLQTWLLGYDETQDRKKFVTMTLYDKIFKTTNYLNFIDQLQRVDIVFEPFTLTSHGRATIDTAALGIPTVGSNRVWSIRKCFPYTAIEPHDIKSARKLIQKILTDEDFKKKVISHALESVEFFNLSNSKRRFLEALKEGSPYIQ